MGVPLGGDDAMFLHPEGHDLSVMLKLQGKD